MAAGGIVPAFGAPKAKGSRGEPFADQEESGDSYLLLMYMVTSKPKRMSLYSGVCHFMSVVLMVGGKDALIGANAVPEMAFCLLNNMLGGLGV